MSASREKKNRQERAESGWTNPKTAREAKQREEERRSAILYGVLAVAFVVLFALILVWKSGIIPKLSTAVTIDGEKYGVGEVEFFYQNAYRGFVSDTNTYYMLSLGLLSLNPSASLDSQTITENDAAMLGLTPAEVGQTWKDYFVSQGLEQMATLQNALKAAEAEGFAYPDSVQAEYDAQMSALRSAAQSSGVSVNTYLAGSLGSQVTEKIYGQQLLRMLQYSAYADAYEESLTYSDSQLEAAYAADRNTYDKADYQYIRVDGSAVTVDEDGNTVEPTEEETAAALAAAKELADEILASWQDGEDPETLADAYDNAYYTDLEGGAYSQSDLGEWVFDEARQAGDSTVIESGTDYYVALFGQRYRDEYNTVSVRHILRMVDETGLDETSDTYESDLQAQKDAAKEEAQALLNQWQSGEATEDSFAALANEESDDGGSNTSGGLYSQFPTGYMVEEFNDWCFDPSRKPGDTGVVYGESSSYKGYHVMYFVGTDLPYWQVQVTSALKNDAMQEWQDAFGENHVIARGSGIRYVG